LIYVNKTLFDDVTIAQLAILLTFHVMSSLNLQITLKAGTKSKKKREEN